MKLYVESSPLDERFGMIADGMWYPATLNKRTTRWIENGCRVTLHDLLWVITPMVVGAGLAIVIAYRLLFTREVCSFVPYFFMVAAMAFVCHMREFLNPLQKHQGVLLASDRLAALYLRRNYGWTWAELAQNSETHRIVDDYLETSLEPMKAFRCYERVNLTSLMVREDEKLDALIRKTNSRLIACLEESVIVRTTNLM